LTGDQQLYEQSLRTGHDYAWEGKWKQAMRAYQAALEEMPEDPVVHSHLGHAYFQLERFERSLEAYTVASRLAPEDPAPLSRIAEIHERLGQRHAAADALYSMARVQQHRHDWTQAIEAIQHALELCPDHAPARMALAELYVEVDQPRRAVKEYLRLARTYQRQGKVDQALEQCRHALDIDPRDLDARALVNALRNGDSVEGLGLSRSLLGEGASPADAAQARALAELANIPFEEAPLVPAAGDAPEASQTKLDLNRSRIDALVARAIDFQTRGLIDEAIQSYTKLLDAGVDRPAVHFTLGLLLQQRLRFESAIVRLKEAGRHPEYRLGSHFALGECYKALGRVDDALEHFIQVLKIVDLETVEEEQAGELVQLYDALSDSYIAAGKPDRALAFSNSLIEFLSSKGWEDKAREARERLNAMSEEGISMSLAEFLAAPSVDTILTAMSLSQEYARQDSLAAAVEVCLGALEVAPTYVPLHLRLAEISTERGRIDEAVAKYQAVAELCLVRQETGQAIGVYRRILRLKPLDVTARSRLIDLLKTCGEIDQALEQYLAIADAYYELAQPDKALERCAEALHLVSRASDEETWQARLLRNMTDMHMRHGNWREALDLYRQQVAISPDDETARLHLIDLNYKLGRTTQADKETMSMLEYYQSRGEEERGVALLEEAVQLQPHQMALRARLARRYLDAGLREDAIQQLDTLGELQLDAGLRKQAMATVRLIISLNPKNVGAYRQLLAQL
jgi:tetratricopeptide (TPR) repeat protein